MADLINVIVSTVLQILVFTLIPFIFYLFRKNKQTGFAEYIGFYKPTGKSILYVIITSLLFVVAGIGLVFTDPGMKAAVLEPKSVTGMLHQMGMNPFSVTILLITALLKTSLSEEILFRGFLAKQLIQKLGFGTGNFLQAIIFGLIHLILFKALTNATIFPLIFIFIFSTVAGWTIGFIKVKYADGSIIPGWIAHGLGNSISYFIIAFCI
jgi:uncharacterized protein